MKPATTKPTLTPKLRFPEFGNAPGWKTMKVDELVDTVTPPKKLPTSLYSAKGAFPIVDQSQDAICGWTDDHEEYKRHYSILKEKPVHFPDIRTGEQHRIASCLSSLDDLIAAERQKLDALKAHKKGLMQHLFPGTPTSSSAAERRADGDVGAPSETHPRLRLPEFRKAGEWAMKVGGDLFTNRKEAGEEGLPIYSVTVNDGMVPRASFDRDFYDIEDPTGNKKACRGDVVYNMMRMWQGAQGVAPENCMVSPAYVVLAPRSGVCADFFAYLFKLPQSLRLLTATSRGLTKDRLRLYFDDFARMRLYVPSFKEQHRIASCLSSLDDLIAAQSDKLEALKTHKKGLMQQLFPSPAEAEA